MPAKSKKQLKFMYAASEGKVPGVSPSVGRDFVQATRDMRGLPERVAPLSPRKKRRR